MSYKFKREDGTIEDTHKEEYFWEAYYTDGTVLRQFEDSDKSFHQFKEIDQSKLSAFKMRPSDDTRGVGFTLLFNPSSMKLIHYYKRYHLDVGGADEKFTLFVFGYENKYGKVLNVITPSGELITTDDITRLKVG